MNTSNELQPLVDTAQMVRIIGISIGTAMNWRSKGKGPRHVQVGHNVRYRIEDIEKWIEERLSE